MPCGYGTERAGQETLDARRPAGRPGRPGRRRGRLGLLLAPRPAAGGRRGADGPPAAPGAGARAARRAVRLAGPGPLRLTGVGRRAAHRPAAALLGGPLRRRRAARGDRARPRPRPVAGGLRAARGRPAGRRCSSRRAPRWWCTRWPCCGVRWPPRPARSAMARAVRTDRRVLGALARDRGCRGRARQHLRGAGRRRRGPRRRGGARGARTRDLDRRWPRRARPVAADAPAAAARRRAAGHLAGGVRPVPARRGRAAARRPGAPARRGRARRRPAQPGPAGRPLRGRRRGPRHPWKGQDVLARALAEPALADIGAVGGGGGRRDRRRRRRRRAWTRWRRTWASATGWCGWASARTWTRSSAPPTRWPCPPPGPSRWAWWRSRPGAAGRPVVASAAGGVAEVVRDGVSGLLVRAGGPRRRWPAPWPGWRPIPRRPRGWAAPGRASWPPNTRRSASPTRCSVVYEAVAPQAYATPAEPRPRPSRPRGHADGARQQQAGHRGHPHALAQVHQHVGRQRPAHQAAEVAPDRDVRDRERDQQVQADPQAEPALHRVDPASAHDDHGRAHQAEDGARGAHGQARRAPAAGHRTRPPAARRSR